MNPEEQNNLNQEPSPAPEVPAEEMKYPENSYGQAPVKHSILGPILVVLIVLLVLILGGLYLWGSMLQEEPAPIVPAERPTAEENNEPESTNAEAEVETINTVSTSDEIGAIEADLEATNLNSIDTDLNAIEAELDAAATQ